MSPTIVDTTPPATQAAILRHIASETHPRLALGNIAHHYGMTLVQLQALLNTHGYPDKALMRRAAAGLEEKASHANDEQPTTDDDAGAGSAGRLMHVALEDLHPDPDNVRESVGDVTELADSMVEAGLIQPIVARRHSGRLYVVAGHRRLAAARLLRWSTIDCVVRDDMTPDDVLAAMLIENSHRADLDPIEEARGLRRLKAQLGDCTDLALARKIGRTTTHVGNRIALLALTPEEQDQVRRGELGITAAMQKGRLTSGRVRPTAKGRPPAGHLSVRHPLASRVQARCTQLGHTHGKGTGVGGVACGECWETVIRADEREKLHAHSAKTGDCALCSAPVSSRAAADHGQEAACAS